MAINAPHGYWSTQKRGKNARAIGLSENRSGGKRMKLREGNESMECAQLTILYRVTIV